MIFSQGLGNKAFLAGYEGRQSISFSFFFSFCYKQSVAKKNVDICAVVVKMNQFQVLITSIFVFVSMDQFRLLWYIYMKDCMVFPLPFQ